MDQNEFLRQIRAYEDADASTLNRAYKVLLTVWRTHPFPILRAQELDAWHGEGYPSWPARAACLSETVRRRRVPRGTHRVTSETARDS